MRHHAAGAGQRPQQLAAQRDHPCGITQRQRTGDVRRGDFTLRMADHGVGTRPRPTSTVRPATPSPRRAPAAPRPRDPGPEHRVRHAGRRSATSRRIRRRPPRTPRSAAANTGAVSSNSMPMPSHCEPWPGKTNTVLPAGAAVPRMTDTGQLVAGQLVQPGQQPVPIAADDDGPMLEGRPAGQRPCHVGDVEISIGTHDARPTERPETATPRPTSPTSPTAPPPASDRPPAAARRRARTRRSRARWCR